MDAADIYITDPQVKQYHLRVLEDDLHYFPSYDAVLLYRADLQSRAPAARDAMLRLEGAITGDEMREMNARVTLDRTDENRSPRSSWRRSSASTSLITWRQWRSGFGANSGAFAAGVGRAGAGHCGRAAAGRAGAHRPWLGHAVLSAVGAVQTVPALAFLVLLVVWLGLGAVPAIVALFCYSLLPIVRNTCAGLRDIPPTIRESADALGLSSFARLYLVDLPLASRSILAGIKTAAVLTVGNATLGGLIGAGGYGLTILIGLNKNDWRLLLEGAVPAMAMALIVQGLFEAAERFLAPKGLRLRPAR